MKKLFLCMVFVLTGCALFRTNEGLVKVNEEYSDVDAAVPNNCARFYNSYIKNNVYTKDETWIVKRGDTIYSISRETGVDIQTLAIKNDLRVPYSLRIGQVLVIGNLYEYTVRKGDTIYSISGKYNIDVKTLASNNNLVPPYTLTVGQRLTITGPKNNLQYTTLSGEKLQLIEADDDVFNKLLAACEACEAEYPEKSKKYKYIISEIKSDIQKHEENERKRQEAKEKAEQEMKKSIDKARQERENISKKYGYPWCNPRYLFFTQNKCMDEVNGAFFQVLQQTPDGTLVSFIKSPDYVLLISKNSKDDSVADGYSIYNGIFAVDGTYQYTSIFGATRTVKRLKRLK